MAPLDISQFNALLHSRNDQTELMSALRKLTTADVQDLADQDVLAGWTSW